MEMIHPTAEAYAKQMTSLLDAVATKNEAETVASHPHAQMHSGHVQGKLLEVLSRMINPLKVLEIGTFTGFSALCLAKGLQKNGMLHTIEIREEDAQVAASCFAAADITDRVTLHIGNAKEIIPGIDELWDLVFIDADKVNYIDYYELTLSRVKPGGWLIADNVLFHGEVLQENIKGKNAIAIQAFNEHVARDNRVEQVLLTVRDGLMLIRKL